jgi:hypothetical protein
MINQQQLVRLTIVELESLKGLAKKLMLPTTACAPSHNDVNERINWPSCALGSPYHLGLRSSMPSLHRHIAG